MDHQIKITIPNELLERLQEAVIDASEVTGIEDYPMSAVVLKAILHGIPALEQELVRQQAGGAQLRIVK